MKHYNKFKRWIKGIWWQCHYNGPMDKYYSWPRTLKNLLAYPYWSIIRHLYFWGFLDKEEGTYFRYRDFKNFRLTFWRRMIERHERAWNRKLESHRGELNRLLEEARRNAQEEVFDYLQKNIGREVRPDNEYS